MDTVAVATLAAAGRIGDSDSDLEVVGAGLIQELEDSRTSAAGIEAAVDHTLVVGHTFEVERIVVGVVRTAAVAVGCTVEVDHTAAVVAAVEVEVDCIQNTEAVVVVVVGTLDFGSM